MNITLSSDKELIEKSRKYAKKHGTTLNEIIRRHLAAISSDLELSAIADEFETLAKNHPGRSESGFRFNRELTHYRQFPS